MEFISLIELKVAVNAVKFANPELESVSKSSGPNFSVVLVNEVSFYIGIGAISTSVSLAYVSDS